ncbi:MAG: acyltransferase [Pseudomonadota bacterium]
MALLADMTGPNAGEGVRARAGRENFFTPLRLLFALMVVAGHAFAISYGDASREPAIFFDYTASYLAVNLFFIASGFLVTGSMLHRSDVCDFTAARLLRIYPALIVHVALVMLVFGPLASSLPISAYLSDPSLWMQPFKVLSFADTQMVLPAAFEANGEPYASVPLWTLRYEMLCYGATLLAFSLGLMRKRWMMLAQFVLPAMIWMLGQSAGLFEQLPTTAENAVRFGMAYGLGAAIYAYRDRLSFRLLSFPVLIAACFASQATVVIEVAVNLLLATTIMFAAFVRVPRLNALQRLDDLSYGLYIYHWVVMQLLFHWMPGLGVAELFALGIGPIIALAWLSWTFVEKPMLAHKQTFGTWLRFGRGEAPKLPVTLAD